MNELKQTIEQVQEKVASSCGEILQVINAASDLLSEKKIENTSDEKPYFSKEESDKEFEFLDSEEDLSELEEFDEEDEEEDEDSKLALQISKLLSEEDEAILEEELEDL